MSFADVVNQKTYQCLGFSIVRKLFYSLLFVQINVLAGDSYMSA